MEMNNRRDFLKKAALVALGVTGGVVATQAGNVTNTVDLSDNEINLLNKFSTWVENFKEVTAIQKSDYENAANNVRMIQLTEEAELWQAELKEMLKNQAFQQEYLKIASVLAQEIDYDRTTIGYL